MNESERNQSFKKLYELTLRYDKNQIIHPNPDMANKQEAELILEKVPDLASIMISGKSKERVHAAFGLKNLSDNKRFRTPLCMCKDFIESVCAVLFMEQNTDAHRRCQQHALAILNNVLLEDPIMDAFIANDENMLPGLAKILFSHDKVTQDLASKCLDYVSVTPENQTLVCSTDNLLKGTAHLLKNSRSKETKNHALQALGYLSSNSNNQFLIARTPELLSQMKECLTLRDPELTFKTIQILYNLCLMKENIPLIAKSNDLRIVLKDRHSELQDLLQTSEEYEGIQIDIVSFKHSGIVLDLLYTYDTRLNSKIILRGEGFHSPSISIGKHVSHSMIGAYSTLNSSMNESADTFYLDESTEEASQNGKEQHRAKTDLK